MPVLKNERHEKFALGIVRGENGRQAYLSAGFDCTPEAADAAASRLLKTVKVQERLNELRNRVIERTLITKEMLEQRVWELAEMAIDQKQLGVAKGCYEMLGRDRGVFVERKSVTVYRSLQEFPLDELEDLIANSAPGSEETPRRGRPN